MFGYGRLYFVGIFGLVGEFIANVNSLNMDHVV